MKEVTILFVLTVMLALLTTAESNRFSRAGGLSLLNRLPQSIPISSNNRFSRPGSPRPNQPPRPNHPPRRGKSPRRKFPGDPNKQVMEKLEQALLAEIANDDSLIASLVQVLFHDCVPFCDGCLDTSNPGNRGLGGTLAVCERLKNDHASKWSLADVIVYCGLRAAKEAAIRAGGDLRLRMYVNRNQCRRRLPHRNIPFGGDTTGLQTLKALYRVTNAEAVALIGAHSLGRCRPSRSGFTGGWDRQQTALDTGYFSNLVSGDWVASPIQNTNVDSHQWDRPGRRGRGPMMLNTDMALRINFDTGAQDKPSCELLECPRASTAEIAETFATDMTAFHLSFQRGLHKMVTNNYRVLKFVDHI